MSPDKFIIVRDGEGAPVVHVYNGGNEVAVIELTQNQTLRLISNLADKLFKTV
tara:strand:- start:8198 stop:8356 length:159 start_codon:yes stop_codon:yes gene_type:complete